MAFDLGEDAGWEADFAGEGLDAPDVGVLPFAEGELREVAEGVEVFVERGGEGVAVLLEALGDVVDEAEVVFGGDVVEVEEEVAREVCEVGGGGGVVRVVGEEGEEAGEDGFEHDGRFRGGGVLVRGEGGEVRGAAADPGRGVGFQGLAGLEGEEEGDGVEALGEPVLAEVFLEALQEGGAHRGFGVLGYERESVEGGGGEVRVVGFLDAELEVEAGGEEAQARLVCWGGVLGAGHLAVLGYERGEQVVDRGGDFAQGFGGFVGADAVDKDF